MANATQHPVWEVYDLLRTSRLNSKYWTKKLVKNRKLNITMEYLMLATAPGSAVAGFMFWGTSGGKTTWMILTGATALLGIAKPLLKLSDYIQGLQKVVTGYRSLEYQLDELRSDILREQRYSDDMVTMFKKLQKQISQISKDEPVEEVDQELQKECFEKVKQELPAEDFFIPQL